MGERVWLAGRSSFPATGALVGMLISIAMLLSYTQRERRAPRLVGVAAVALPLAFVAALVAWAITGG